MSSIRAATSFQPSAMRMPPTAVSIAWVGPPLSVPGLGSNVSNWLGAPRMNSRMQAMPRLRSSSACSVSASFQPQRTGRPPRLCRAATDAVAIRKNDAAADDAIALVRTCMEEIAATWMNRDYRFV